jgi:hypothetical protein
MKAKYSLGALAILIVLVLGLTVGCQRGRTDAQIATDVQNKIYSDSAVQSRQVTVQSSNGVVTLSGYVSGDPERTAAANDAATVDGVRTVVNNLEAQPQVASNTPAPQPAVQEPPKEEPAPAHTARRRSRESQSGTRRVSSTPAVYNDTPAPVTTATNMAPAPPVNTPPPPPAPPAKVTIASGTQISIRMIDSLDSERSQMGDTFRASLDAPIMVDDNVVIPAGADIVGRVADVKSAGRFAGQSTLAIELTKLNVNGKTYPIQTNQWSRAGASRGKNTAAKVGGGAGLGAIIGAIAGGGKGAAIGATVGAGAGGGVQAATKGQQIKLSPEQVLNFQLQSPITVTPVKDLNPGRKRMEVSEDQP